MFGFFSTCTVTVCCFIFGSTRAENNCGLSRTWLETVSVTMDIRKNGFHRELVTTVDFSPGFPDGLEALLVYSLPNGIYIDPYQLASLKEEAGLQVLLSSPVDLEAPAHMSEKATTFVYLLLDQGGLRATVPIHGRYHKPSLAGKSFEHVKIELPKLKLRTNTCEHLLSFPPYKMVDAPCSVQNVSMCHWLEIQLLKDPDPVSFPLPLGDGSLVVPVCAGNLMVTLLCFIVLSRSIWTHGVF
ncbi:hypothetical protein DPEC_G00267170 [Dallia pectoralis]|uniref:Uncharacterized protein n=1 Tax=Dallia pectoralis TaxID=75939 RepID=A0ACC2FNE6_DALPE|nr:hypothetical protein DPEC_G00267170 [Dallia pectoralis]